MSCILRISGKKSFNIDNFHLEKDLKPITIHLKGELDFRKRKIENTQLIYDVSNGDLDDLNKSIKDAIKFLKKHKMHLKKISLNKSIDSIALDFSINSRIDNKKVVIQNDYFPVELIKLAGDLNMSIWLSQWPYEKKKA